MPFDPPRRVLIVVENLPVPLDRRVWLEATTLRAAGIGQSKPRRGSRPSGRLRRMAA